MLLDLNALPPRYQQDRYKNLQNDLRRIIYALQNNATHVLGEINYTTTPNGTLIMRVQRKPDMSGTERWVNVLINRPKRQIIAFFNEGKPLHLCNDDTGAFVFSEKFLAGTFRGTTMPDPPSPKIRAYNSYVPRVTVKAS